MENFNCKILFGSQQFTAEDVLEVVSYPSIFGEVKLLCVRAHDSMQGQYYDDPAWQEWAKKYHYPEQWVAEIVDGSGKEVFLPLVYEGHDDRPFNVPIRALTAVLQKAAREHGDKLYHSDVGCTEFTTRQGFDLIEDDMV